ncbi:hypothetical protein E2320_007526, partial [Naja naja]
GQSSEESESGTSLTSSSVSTGQRRRHHKEQDEDRKTRDREVINKENIPSGFSSIEECMLNAQEVEKCHENSSGYIGERSKPKRQKSSTKLSEFNDNQESSLAMETFGSLRHVDGRGPDEMEVFPEESKNGRNEDELLMHNQVFHFKYLGIQFQNTGTWTRHRIQVLNSASCSHQQILRFFYTQGGQFIPSALRIYKAKTFAQTLYGIPIWIRGFKDCIERSQAVFLRKLLGLPPCVGFAPMYLELGTRSVECMVWINTFKWWFRVLFLAVPACSGAHNIKSDRISVSQEQEGKEFNLSRHTGHIRYLSSSMKIQEHPGVPEVKLQRNQEIDAQEDTFISEVPRLDLSTLCSDNWE